MKICYEQCYVDIGVVIATNDVVICLLVALFLGSGIFFSTRGMGRLMPPPHKVFLSFFLEDKTSAPGVFSSCSFIPHPHFETSLVIVSCYGYEI